MLRCVFEPSQKVERFIQIPAVMESSGDPGKVFKADSDMVRVFFDELID